MRPLGLVLLLAAACASGPEKPAGIRWIPSPNFNEREGAKIDAVVIHTTEGAAGSAIRHFQKSESEVSAHFVIAPDGAITQMVALEKRAWHATYYNSRSIGIEMDGHAGDPATWTTQNLKALAELTAWLCDTYKIPAVHPTAVAGSKEQPLSAAGLVAHGQVQPWNRTDPGPHFPWAKFVLDVRRALR